ncbi:MAG: HPr family phosphocarrier protein [Oscillospiraceae bacterium]|nr:HPr family phosphocarrier protein [Oscillospiraceae bacterium]
MISFEYKIKDKYGIHARPAGMLAKLCKQFESEVTIQSNGKKSPCTKLMAVMAMEIKNGDTVTVSVEGNDELQAANAVKSFFEESL